MAVIKSHNAAGMLKEAIVLDLGDLGRQAAKLQAAAEARARKTLGDAEQEAMRIIADASVIGMQQGKAEGQQQGLAEGRKQGRADALKQSADEFKRVTTAWTEAIRSWEETREAVERDARQAVIELSLRLAEKIVNRIIEVDPSVIVDQVAGALAHVLQRADVTVRINPQDRPVLEEALPGLIAEFAHLQHIRITEDADMLPGGCKVTYGEGEIDATIDTQFARVVDLLLPVDGSESDLSDDDDATNVDIQPQA